MKKQLKRTRYSTKRMDIYNELRNYVKTNTSCVRYEGNEVWLRDVPESIRDIQTPIPFEVVTHTGANYCYMNPEVFVVYKYPNSLDICKELGLRIHTSANWKVLKLRPNAVIPHKAKQSDVGYDVTVIHQISENLYGTGLKIFVDHGYFEIVPRSSLYKSGYILANSVGIIDPGYTGEIMIALLKINPNAEDIKLPFRCCQLIYRENHEITIEEVSEEPLVTMRKSGGFGSTKDVAY